MVVLFDRLGQRECQRASLVRMNAHRRDCGTFVTLPVSGTDA
jgi:hypothetical protein